MHVCWGNYAGPHTHDIPISRILPACVRARPSAISFEGANPQHAHEWEDIRAIGVPDDKILIPGVIDSATNYVEHPKLVAQRLLRFSEIVGQERVIAGVDCGFGTFASVETVSPSVAWTKLQVLAEGAKMATEALRM